MAYLKHIIVLLWLGFALVGCGESECESDQDCPDGLRCIQGGGVFSSGGVCAGAQEVPNDMDVTDFGGLDQSLEDLSLPDAASTEDMPALPDASPDMEDLDAAEDMGLPPVFGYLPANVDLAGLRPMDNGVVIDCEARFDTGTLTFEQWCNQTEPAPVVRVSLDGGVPDLVVLAMSSLRVEEEGSLTVTGDRPLALIVFGDTVVEGTIFAGATGRTSGPGSIDCQSGDGSFNNSNGGGGAGASHASAGGSGGNSGTGTLGGTAVSAYGESSLQPLRGGCPGGRGGGIEPDGGRGGGGGGALQISTAGEFRITGVIASPGGGGAGAPAYGRGGGGGGSGGGILLEARTLILAESPYVTAIGGGGGGGGSCTFRSGYPGEDGPTDSLDRASGGEGAAAGDEAARSSGDGGRSGSQAGVVGVSPESGRNGMAPPGCAPVGGGGGGGGGGSVGRIRIQIHGGSYVSTSANFNPEPSIQINE